MSNLPTTDQLALFVAEQAYGVVRAARIAQGAQDLPSWDQVPDLKQIYLTNSARAALDGAEVWDVWSLSCGSEPDDATQTLWKTRPPLLRLLPATFVNFGRAVALARNLDTDILSDVAEPSVEELVEEHGLGDERISEALTELNEGNDPIEVPDEEDEEESE